MSTREVGFRIKDVGAWLTRISSQRIPLAGVTRGCNEVRAEDRPGRHIVMLGEVSETDAAAEVSVESIFGGRV